MHRPFLGGAGGTRTQIRTLHLLSRSCTTELYLRCLSLLISTADYHVYMPSAFSLSISILPLLIYTKIENFFTEFPLDLYLLNGVGIPAIIGPQECCQFSSALVIYVIHFFSVCYLHTISHFPSFQGVIHFSKFILKRNFLTFLQIKNKYHLPKIEGIIKINAVKLTCYRSVKI